MLERISRAATYYYHPDHLGSVSVVSNHKGEPYERVEYLPFGEIWIEDTDPATSYIPFRFTSKELDEETGLYYYGARYYEPKMSRWMSADPAGFALIDPNRGGYSVKGRYSVIEATNWYSYVSNNPVRYVDPTGMWTFQLGVYASSGGSGVGGKVEIGFAFAYDKEESVLSMGIYTTEGAGISGPAGVSAGITGGISGIDSVEDLEGRSEITGASVGAPVSLGTDLSIPFDSDNRLNDSVKSISLGIGGSAEGHALIADTKVTGIKEIDISQVAGSIEQAVGKVAEGINELPSILYDTVKPPFSPDPSSVVNP